MSERGSFVSEFIYCEECYKNLRKLFEESGVEITFFEHPTIKNRILTGKIRGGYSGHELDCFRWMNLLPRLLCHNIKIVVIPDTYQPSIFLFTTKGEILESLIILPSEED